MNNLSDFEKAQFIAFADGALQVADKIVKQVETWENRVLVKKEILDFKVLRNEMKRLTNKPAMPERKE